MYDGVKNFDRQTDRQTGRQTSLDGLKGLLACVIAFVWHYQHFQPIGSPFYTILKPFYDYGYLGVEIFYMLSGFGMILGYEKRIAESEMLPLEYFGRRLKKLYPPVLLSTIVTGVLQIVYLYQNGMIFQYAYDYFNIDYFILNLIGIQTGIINRAYSFNGPLWFVSVLLVCYIIFYLLIYLNKNREELLPIFYWLIGILGIAIIYSNINVPILNEEMGRGLSCFFIGTIVANGYQKRKNLKCKNIAYIMLILVMISVVLSYMDRYEVIGDIRLFVIIALGPMLIWICLFIPFISKMLSSLKFLGDISLEIFVWHFPIQIIWKIISMNCYHEIDFHQRTIWILYVTSVLCFAWIYKKYATPKIENSICNMIIRKEI